MSRRNAITMTDVETAAFLADRFKVQVATIGPDGTPHLTTLFYVLDEGRIAFWTYARSQKVRNLERDPRITCLVEDGEAYAELRGASVTGRVELVRDSDAVRRIGSAVVARMTGVATIGELGEAGVAEVARQAAKRVVVVVRPERVATWDHAKLV